MKIELSLSRIVLASLALVVLLFAVGWMTRQDPATKDYLKVVGGGFMYNYREGDVYYVLNTAVMRPLPTGSIIEAAFEDPAGGDPLVVRQRVGTNSDVYALHSPEVRGVEKGKEYDVTIRVYDRGETQLLWTHDVAFKSQLDDKLVPEHPLVIGPGYHRNSAAAADG